VKQHKLRKMIAWLSGKEGRGMEFVTLYVPGHAAVDEVVVSLKRQRDSAVAKSERVEGRVQEAFRAAIEHLKARGEVPESGLAVFAGTFLGGVPEREVLTVEELVPPEPVVGFVCEVDDHFDVAPLRMMLRDPRVVGLIALDAKEASFGMLDGERLEFAESITSGVPGKSGKGGQSQRRYERERDMELTYFFHRVAEHAAKVFLGERRVLALVVGGPGSTKNDFLKGDYLHYELRNVVLDVVDTQCVTREGVREVFEKSADVLKNMCGPEERLVVRRFLAELGKQDGLAVYGLDTVFNALRNGEVEVALVTDSTEMVEVDATCKKCGLPRSRFVGSAGRAEATREMISRPCERCGAAEFEMRERDIVDVLEDAATQTDARVEVISTASDEKAKLAGLGGFGALLRWKSG
jgi:peptide chain release factor subunit 1